VIKGSASNKLTQIKVKLKSYIHLIYIKIELNINEAIKCMKYPKIMETCKVMTE